MAQIEVKGLRELSDVLEKLPLELQRKAMRPALTKAASVIAEEARRRAPSVTGELRQKINVSAKVDPGIGGETYAVVRSGSRKSHLIEFTTAAHKIIGKFKRVVKKLTKPTGKKKRVRNVPQGEERSVLATKDKIFGREVQHPGTKARPFMRPAFDATYPEALKVFKETLHDSLVRTIKSAVKKLK